MKYGLLLDSFIASVIGLAMIMSSRYLGLLFGTLFFAFGAVVICLGFGLLGLFLWETGRSAKRALEQFREENSGIAWIIAVAVITVLLWPFVYWVIGMPYLSVQTFAGGMVTLTGFLALVNTFQQIMIAALPAFVLFIVLIWSVVQSHAEAQYGGG